VSMGLGQEIVARRFITKSTASGGWVLLQKTHLGPKYLIELEQNMVKMEDAHTEFRVWITAEPHPGIPIGLLQMSIKITNEAPVGMRAGMKRSYAWVSQDMIDTVPRVEWRMLLWMLCHLHSVVQERRKFGAIGWTVPYEFNQSDLNACALFIQNHILDMDAKKAKDVTWSTVRYMTREGMVEFVDTVGEEENTHQHVEQEVVVTSIGEQPMELYKLVKEAMREDEAFKIIAFFTTARQTQLHAELFNKLGFPVLEIHSRLSQSARKRVSEEFRNSKGGSIMFTSDVSFSKLDDKTRWTAYQVMFGREGKHAEDVRCMGGDV